MQYLGKLKVIPELPDEIKRLKELAYNLYFSWTPEARQIFRLIDPKLWTRLNHNPVKFLKEVQQKDLEKCASDPLYLSFFKKVMVEFDQYMNAEDTWFSEHFPKDKDKIIAYLSAEFGLHESLPIYSGGLGVLAGDHLKTASDLDLPLLGVSMFYHQTYFTQQIDAHGNQIALYIPFNPEDLPLHPVLDTKGKAVEIVVHVGNRNVKVHIWQVQVGRISAYLLDTDIPENLPEDRMITSRLYGGDQEMRISQEIILGIGGAKALKRLNIQPDAWHMNEGHSVFSALERIRDLVKTEKLTFYEALEAVSANTIFTTHTPVPAGNDAFPLHFVDKYFQRYWESVGIRRYQFMELGSQLQPEGYEIFNLTILSLKLSRFRNGVSKLHGEVSRKLWKDVWPQIPSDEIPITSITNGVHAHTWAVYKICQLFDQYLGKDWPHRLDEPLYWKGVFNIPDEVFWKVKLEIKEKLMNHLKERLQEQVIRNKVGTLHMHRLKSMLKTNILTVGFARRFATYKRGTLVFRDPERLKRILNHPERPVQFIFAGKAHPRDAGGQELIRRINEYAMQDDFRGKVFFMENYDMGLARDLVSGVDVWLNNPRRPQEASGTSGQKVGMNGGVNLSVLDGWWCEGYNGKNGFAFGDREDYKDLEELDTWDSDAIYDILENDLVPVYYERDEHNLPRRWIELMKHSLASILPVFNAHRMVKEYTEQLYLPAVRFGEEYAHQRYEIAREYAGWRENIEDHWSQVKIETDSEIARQHEYVLKYNEPLKLKVQVKLGKLAPSDVKVQVYLIQEVDEVLKRRRSETIDMVRKKVLENNVYQYEATIKPSDSGRYKYTVRILPYHKNHLNLVEMGLVHWVNNVEENE